MANTAANTGGMTDPAAGPRYWRLSGIGLVVAAVFFSASLTPSLIPRSGIAQGVLSGVAMALGYLVTAFGLWLWRLMLLPVTYDRRVRLVLYGVAVLIAILALIQLPAWQNATRAVMDLPPVETGHRAIVACLAAAVFALLWLIGSLFMMVARRAGRALSLILPGRLGIVAGVLIAAIAFAAFTNGVLVRRGMTLADAAFAAGEQIIDPRFQKPTDAMMTGSEQSLIAWDDLGNRGRDFVGRTPTPEEISAFTGKPAKRSARVYVGRVSAETARERAELALQELIRVGGFEREILIVTTPVGTGWMDPGAHDTIDFMFGGDTAQVAVQYSYLTSVLSILTNVEYGLDQARELFDVIHDYWSTLPPGSRPKLYIHGLSQGALNSQATLPLFDVLADPPQGAFWAGSPFLSPIWTYVRNRRNPGSPAWRPRFGNGSMVRTTNQQNVLDEADAPWGPIRFVFLNYGSDPIVFFDFAMLWRPPAWLAAPRAPDVAPQMRWFPLVTAFQVALDMLVALSVERHGHFYVYQDYINGWAALTDPPDWSDERSEALKAVFAKRPLPW